LVKNRPTVALFGGSFDPPHKAHQRIAQKVSALQDIDYLVIMPAYLNPFKTASLVSAEKRLEWCKKVCLGKKIIVSDFEASLGRPVYTIETLRMLQAQYEVKYLVIGADNLEKIEAWKAFDEINASVTWLVFSRDGGSMPNKHPLKRHRYIALDMPVSSSKIRKGEDFDAIAECISVEVTHHIQEGTK